MREFGPLLGDIHDFSSEEAQQLLHNKFVVIIGDSIYRSMYKDLIYFLQTEEMLALPQLQKKGEETFASDRRVEFYGLHSGNDYREVRQYRTGHHLVRFYFITRVYSSYMESILNDFKAGLESGLIPDVVVINSCIWDLNRYHDEFPKEPPLPKAIREYRQNLEKLFAELDGILPSSCLIIWDTALPISENPSGSCFKHPNKSTPADVIVANFCSAILACYYTFDVLDLHYCFRFLEQHHYRDGVHWNSWAHRGITKLLLTHMADAWGVELEKRKTHAGIEWDGNAATQPFYSQQPVPQLLQSPLGLFNSNNNPCAQRSDSYGFGPVDGSEDYWETPAYPGQPNPGHGANFPHNPNYVNGPTDGYAYEQRPQPCPSQLHPGRDHYFLDNANFANGPLGGAEDYWGPPPYPGQLNPGHDSQCNGDYMTEPVDEGEYEQCPPPYPGHFQPGADPYMQRNADYVNGSVDGCEYGQEPPPYSGRLYLRNGPYVQDRAHYNPGPWDGPPPHLEEIHPIGFPAPGPNGGGEHWPFHNMPRRSHRKARAGRSRGSMRQLQRNHSQRDRAQPYARRPGGSGNPQQLERAPFRGSRPCRQPRQP